MKLVQRDGICPHTTLDVDKFGLSPTSIQLEVAVEDFGSVGPTSTMRSRSVNPGCASLKFLAASSRCPTSTLNGGDRSFVAGLLWALCLSAAEADVYCAQYGLESPAVLR